MTEEQKIKHLEFIQNIITRMNTNSFQIKGLTITIVSALLAIYASEKKIEFILITILPTLIFWFLDSYYLTQERKFRGLYKDIVDNKLTDLKPFDMKVDIYKKKRFSYWNVFFSKTILFLYLSITITMLIIYNCLK